jgi:hypothetical protein
MDEGGKICTTLVVIHEMRLSPRHNGRDGALYFA